MLTDIAPNENFYVEILTSNMIFVVRAKWSDGFIRIKILYLLAPQTQSPSLCWVVFVNLSQIQAYPGRDFFFFFPKQGLIRVALTDLELTM